MENHGAQAREVRGGRFCLENRHDAGVLTSSYLAVSFSCLYLRPPPPPRVGYEAIVDGFADPLRTYELPGRMGLANMTDVLNDVWEIDGVC